MINQIISKIFKTNIVEKESEIEYWDRKWQKHINYFKLNKKPLGLDDLWRKYFYTSQARQYEKIFKKYNCKNIIEAGSGSGFTSLMIAKNNPDMNFTLVDLSVEAIEYINLLITYFNLKNIKVIKQDIFNKDFLFGQQFDAVYNLGVIEHYHKGDRLRLIKNMSRLIRDGGLILITYPNLLSPELIYKMSKEGKGSENYLNFKILKKEISLLKNLTIEGFYPAPFWCPSFIQKEFLYKFSLFFKIQLLLPFFSWLHSILIIKK